MTKLIFSILVVFLAGAVGPYTHASSVLHLSVEEHFQASCAVFRGTVVAVESFKNPRDGQIYTRTLARVDEPFKGKLPPIVKLIHRGGIFAGEGEMDGFAPQFKAGEERLLFLSRRGDGTLYATLGGLSALKLADATALVPRHQNLLEKIRALARLSADAGSDVTDQGSLLSTQALGEAAAGAAVMPGVMGLLVDGNGLSARFLQPDRGEPIPYLVDADSLPGGITLTQALQAVENALAAWTAVTSLRYRFEGVQSFGMAAVNVLANDGKLRIQLHDNYGFIPGTNTLAIGSRAYITNIISPAGWATGGNVAGHEFHESIRGSIVVKHTQSALQTLTTLTEVLTHEVGHTVSMAHSSEDPDEADPLLKESIMYVKAHADGRGAALGSYDPPIIRQVHPPGNAPPYTYPRVMDIVTDSPSPPSIPGINEIELRGYDLQSTNLSLATTNATTSNGAFSQMGNTLKFTPAYVFGPRLDPAVGSYYGRVAARFSDGTNASPFVFMRVISLNPDNWPSPVGDGIPDNWMTTYFGNANPAAGPNRGANADFDGDGTNNKTEFLIGSNPTNANSNLQITAFGLSALQWEAKAFELYEVQRSTELSTWTRAANPVVPSSSVGTATGISDGTAAREFFRVLKVP